MNDLEELLRTDLARAAESIDSGLDADDLLADGHRVRRSRTMRLGVGLTAILVTMAGLGVMVASTLGSGSQAPVLATPSPVPSPSASTTPLVAPGTTGQVVFDSGPLVEELMAAQVRMNATVLTDGRYSVKAELVRGDRVDYQDSAINDGRAISWFQMSSRVLVGFVPHRLDWIQYRDEDQAGSFGRFNSDQQTFAQLDATVVYRIAAESSGDYAGLRGYLWRDLDGRYHDDAALLPSDTYNGATLYLSERLAVFGMVQDGTSTSVEERTGHASFLNSWTSLKNTQAAAAVLLPPGASRPKAHLGVNGVQLNVTSLGERILLVATATVPDDTAVLITSVTYTDASGKKVTDKG